MSNRKKHNLDLWKNTTILSSISAILASIIAVLTVSNVHLTYWWHFLLAFFAIVGTYFGLWILSVFILKFLYKHQAIEVDVDGEFQINEMICAAQELYDTKKKYDNEEYPKAKELLRSNIIYKCRQLESKIDIVSTLSNNEYTSDVRIDISDALLQKYKEFVEDIKVNINPQNYVI